MGRRWHMVSDQVHVTVQEAAARCNVSVESIRRRLKAGRLAGARRTGDPQWGPWLIPLSSLQPAGLNPHLGEDGHVRVEDAEAELVKVRGEHVVALEQVAYLRDTVARLEVTLEREREVSNDYRLLLERMLTSPVSIPETTYANGGR
jgi:hypothetical protein